MLILSRELGQTIRIGDTISVTVMDVRGDKVRLGVEAPLTTVVHRSEVYDRIHGVERTCRTCGQADRYCQYCTYHSNYEAKDAIAQGVDEARAEMAGDQNYRKEGT